MMPKIEFGQDELETLLNLKTRAELDESRIAKLERIVKRQQEIISRMVWASSKIAVLGAGMFGGIFYVGYWLTDAVNFKAVTTFLKTIKGE